MRSLTILVLAITAVCSASSDIATKSCEKCVPNGTKSCSTGFCECLPGFEGYRCQRCKDGHFGPSCHPIAECCRKIDYFEFLQPGRTETTKLRKRRQIEVDYRGCEYPAELCEVERTIMNLYDSLDQLPYTDDLGPFMADINHKIADILELKLKIDEKIPMEDGLTAAYHNFTKFANDRLERLGVNISEIEAQINDLRSNDDPNSIDLEKLTKMLDDMQQLLVNKSIAQSQARAIDQAGIRLERDVYTETLRYLKDINDHLPEVEELKKNLIDTLDDINNNITDEFYDGNVPLFDDVMAKKEAKRLRLKVEETHSMLPHGHPDIMSWFDEAEWTHDQINQTADYLIGVLENITDHVELIANQTQQLKEKTEAAENWKSETIDIRKLVFYIDILNDMADNDNNKHSSITVDGKEVTVDGMFEELSKVMALQKKMNEVFKNSTLNPADFQGTQDKLDRIEDKFEQLRDTVDAVNSKLIDLGKVTDNLNTTTILYGQTIDKIEGNLDKLEETLGKGSSDVENLKKDIEEIQPKLQKTMNSEQAVVDEINKEIKGNKNERQRKKRNTCKSGRCSISEKMRNRKKRQLKRKRRQSNKDAEKAEKLKKEHIQKIKQLLENTIKLQNDIADYREGSDDYFFKTYIESIQKNQEDAKGMKDTLNKLCEDCAEDYKNAEKKLKADIEDLRKEAEKLSNGIFKCIEDPCWPKNLLDNSDTRPESCT